MKLQSFVFNPFQENTYVLYDETKDCVIIDPGCFDYKEKATLEGFIEQHGLNVKLLLNTHCHIDHVLGNFFVKERFKTKLLIHEADKPTLVAVRAYAPNYGFYEYQETLPDGYMQEGDVIKFGNQELKVIHVPGHSPGHVAFYNQNRKILIGGDVLFYNSIGRTDLPGGNFQVLIDSIHHKLFTLPDDVKVYPGHGAETTLGFEKTTNPFCALTKVS